MKFRLVKYLVTEMGFTNFAMEEDWGNGLKLNEYIQTGKTLGNFKIVISY